MILFFSKYYFIYVFWSKIQGLCKFEQNRSSNFNSRFGSSWGIKADISVGKSTSIFLRTLNFLCLVGGYNGIGDRVNNSYTPFVNLYVRANGLITGREHAVKNTNLIGETISLIS